MERLTLLPMSGGLPSVRSAGLAHPHRSGKAPGLVCLPALWSMIYSPAPPVVRSTGRFAEQLRRKVTAMLLCACLIHVDVRVTWYTTPAIPRTIKVPDAGEVPPSTVGLQIDVSNCGVPINGMVWLLLTPELDFDF